MKEIIVIILVVVMVAMILPLKASSQLLEWVEEGKGVATIKYDGSCCAIIERNVN